MSRRKSIPTFHAQYRAKQRANIKKKELLIKANYVSKNGKCPQEFTGKFKKYLLKKAKVKRVKVYDNYIWIFSKTSTKLITMYKIPDEFLNNVKE